MQTLRSVVPGNIRAEMARRRVPQRRVADALGISQQSLSLKLSGRRPLSIEEVESIARELDVDPRELLARSSS